VLPYQMAVLGITIAFPFSLRLACCRGTHNLGICRLACGMSVVCAFAVEPHIKTRLTTSEGWPVPLSQDVRADSDIGNSYCSFAMLRYAAATYCCQTTWLLRVSKNSADPSQLGPPGLSPGPLCPSLLYHHLSHAISALVLVMI
jgi:hypothetical protein